MIATKYPGVHYRVTADGRKMFYVSYKGLDGKLVRRKIGSNKEKGINAAYCKNLREASILKQRLGENAPVQKRSSTKVLREVADAYFEQLEAKSTDKLKSVYTNHLVALKDMPVNAIDKVMIERLKKDKSSQVSAKTGRLLSDKTVNNILSILSAILHYAKEEGYVKGVPTVTKYKEDNARERFLSTSEIDALLAAIEKSNLGTKDRVLLFTKLSLMTGGRLGSILSIQGKHIDKEHGTVTLRNHKTEKDYTAFLPESLLAEIPQLKPQQYLIAVSDAKQIQRPLQGILDTLFNQGLDAEDRKQRVVVHTLRHTYASHLAINGTPIHTIMKLMNHTDIKMTLRYAKLMPDSGRDMVEGLYK